MAKKKENREEEGMTDKQIVDWILSCRDEAHQAKKDRMLRNRQNFDMFHLKYDFAHKKEGQSTEVLSRQSMAVEQIKSFFQQALADLGDWWKCEQNFVQDTQALLITPEEITKLTNYFLQKASYFSHVGCSIESALLGSLAISKVYGCEVSKPKYVAKKKGRGANLTRWIEKVEDKTWEMKFDIVRAENYYPDPSGAWLYEIEDSWPDLKDLLYRAEEDEDYNLELIESVPATNMSESEQEMKKARETGQNTTTKMRPKPKLTEFWGTILNPTTGKVEFENVQAIIMNDTHLIMRPRPNPLWHQQSPYCSAPLMEVPNSVWHRAPMDAPTQHNRALIEMYNLMVDAGMMQVHGIKQIRRDVLDNPAQVSDGIRAGTTIAVNSALPMGGKVVEDCVVGEIPSEAMNIFNLMSQEFNASAMTNDLRNGVMPFRAVKATEVVEASQTITSVFQGMAKNWEGRQSTKELELAWMTTAQNWNSIDKAVFKGLFGPQRGEELYHLSPQEVFANTVGKISFKVYGVSLTLSKSNDFRKLTTLLQTVFSNPALTELFMQKYDPARLLGEIMTSLDIDKEKLEHPPEVAATMQPQDQQQPGQPPQGGPQPAPNAMSQVPQAQAMNPMAAQGGPQIPSAHFPGSPAIKGMSTK